MANEIRVRSNFQSGTIDDNPLSNSATTLTSTELAGLPAISASEHCAIVLDPTGAGNGPEIVHVTAHTGSATTATIVRGREGTSGVQHASTITWVHTATRADYEMIGATADRPSGSGLPYKWQRYFDTDLGHPLIWNGSAWVQLTPESDTVATSESTTSTSYVDLATAGPAVTITTGTTALVTVGGNLVGSAEPVTVYMTYAVSGASTVAASATKAALMVAAGVQYGGQVSYTAKITGLTAGANTFTAKYRVNTGTGTFENRTITAQGLL